jgi:hypothetical protein
VYVYSNGVTKPYKSYTELKDVVMEFPGMMSSNNSTKEELVSVLKKTIIFMRSLHKGKT